jgi:hypothetical protein
VGSQGDLDALVATATDLLQQLQDLQKQCGARLEQLAAMDWQALAQQGKLAGIPKITIERTIMDARTVLRTGLGQLAAILDLTQQFREGPPDPESNVPDRLRAMIRMYADTPQDIRNRCQRLETWLAKIDLS